ncbi:MAG: ABC transporter substrate-binding protein [Bdellovibrionota bacterium]
MFKSALVFLGLFTTSLAFAEKTFVYCSEGSPSTFNPHIASDGTTFNASSHPIYDTLIKFKQGSVDIEPGLAESWKVDKAGTKYTFKLRKGVKFHSNALFTPTRDFNADDVVYSFEVQKDTKHPLAIKNGNYEYFKGMEMDKVVKDIKKVDDYTVEFNLTHPEAPFLANIAMDFASILSKEYAESLVKSGKGLDTLNIQPIGTGPFVFKSYQKDTIIRYTSNPSYWGGKTKIDNLIFSITPDASVRFQKLKAGECHFIADPAPADLENIAKVKGIKLVDREGLNVGYLAMNTEKKPFDNVKVRQAVNHALNRKSYMSAIYMGRAVVAKNPMPPGIWGYNDAVKDYEYNPEKSKQLLKEAGLPDGFTTELWAMPISRPYNPSGKKLAELMQADLAKVGIKVTIQSFDWPIYLEKARKGEHTMIQMGWTGDNGDPDNFLHILLSCAGVKAGSNNARWCNKSYDDLVIKAKQVTEKNKRSDLYKQAQVVFKDQAPWVTVAHAKTFRAMSDKVSGYMIHPFGGDIFDKVDIK